LEQIMRNAMLFTIGLLVLAAGPLMAQKPKVDPKAPKLQPGAMYRCVLGSYTNDSSAVPFTNLQVPNGTNLLNDDVLGAMRGKISIGEIGWRGSGYIYIPADGAYEIDSNAGGIAINGKQLGLGRKSGSVDLAKGIYSISLSEPNHGQPYLNSTTFKMTSKDTLEEVPIFNTGKDIQQFARTPVGSALPTLVAPWDMEGAFIADKVPKK